KARHHKAQEYQHFHQSEPAQGLEVHGPRIEKDDLHIEQDEEDGDEKVLHRKRCAGIARLLDAAFEAPILVLASPLRPEPCGRAQGTDNEGGGNDHLDDHREIVMRCAHSIFKFRANLRVRHRWCKGNREGRGNEVAGTSLHGAGQRACPETFLVFLTSPGVGPSSKVSVQFNQWSTVSEDMMLSTT